MTARARIHAMFTLDEHGERELNERLDALVDEILTADGHAYPGELAMYRSLVRTLRVVVRDSGSAEKQRAEVCQLLHEHAADDAAARAQAPRQGSRTADPDQVSAREARLAQLLDTIRSRPGKWTTGLVQGIRRTTGGPVQRGTARRDLDELHRRGHLAKHGAGDGRYYTLRRKDGAA